MAKPDTKLVYETGELLSSLEWIFIDLIISYVHNIQSVLG
jgi:hypothetical protein